MSDEKSVLISIHPEFIQAICDGRKALEIRKTIPKADTPFKVYMYCTRMKERVIEWVHDGDDIYGDTYHGKPFPVKCATRGYAETWVYGGSGKVVGEFTCRRIAVCDLKAESVDEFARFGCVTPRSIHEYAGGRDRLYGLYVDDFVWYREPLELDDFGLKRPPQSWCYVQQVGR